MFIKNNDTLKYNNKKTKKYIIIRILKTISFHFASKKKEINQQQIK